MTERLQDYSRKVLIIEDDNSLSSFLPELFEGEGIEAVGVRSLEEAKKALKQGNFTEVITDSLRGGWVAVVESVQGLPVRLFSANKALKTEAQQRGVLFLEKPGNLDEILADPRQKTLS